MKTSSAFAIAAFFCAGSPLPCVAETTVIVVTGAPGGQSLSEEFLKQATAWREAAGKAGARLIEIGITPPATADQPAPPSDFEILRTTLAAEKPDGPDTLWLIMNGHGTWDGKVARFNLRGPDVSAEELAAWMKPLQRPAVIINTSSSSAPFLAKLSGPGRTVITATRSGSEQNLTRFGTHLAASLTDPAEDLDTDGTISILEAFLAGARRTAEFYKTEGRLATEHPLIDDNGDGMGTPADWFKGLRAVKKSAGNNAIDGAAARHSYLIPPVSEKNWPEETRKHRDNLEARLAALREAKVGMKEDAYYAQLETLLLELARLTTSAPAAAQP